jgi:hypothetical protein
VYNVITFQKTPKLPKLRGSADLGVDTIGVGMNSKHSFVIVRLFLSASRCDQFDDRLGHLKCIPIRMTLPFNYSPRRQRELNMSANTGSSE